MKKRLALVLFIGVPAFGTTNQLDFMWGRNSPQGSIQALGSSEADGLRGSFWFLDAFHQASEHVYFGMGLGHAWSDDNNSATFAANTNSTISSQKSSTLVLARIDLGPNARFIPYAIVGIGWVKNSLLVSATPTSPWSDTGTSEQRTFIDQSKSTFGYAGGLGMDMMLGDRLLIGIEARYDGSPAQHFAMTPDGIMAAGTTDVRTSMNLFLVGLKAGVKY